MITVQLVCVYVGHPGDGDVYEAQFVDTETMESSGMLRIGPDGSLRLEFLDGEGPDEQPQQEGDPES